MTQTVGLFFFLLFNIKAQIKAKILLTFLEQILAFVGDAEKFKTFKEKYCNGRRRKLNKSSKKENTAPSNAPVSKRAKTK